MPTVFKDVLLEDNSSYALTEPVYVKMRMFNIDSFYMFNVCVNRDIWLSSTYVSFYLSFHSSSKQKKKEQ